MQAVGHYVFSVMTYNVTQGHFNADAYHNSQNRQQKSQSVAYFDQSRERMVMTPAMTNCFGKLYCSERLS